MYKQNYTADLNSLANRTENWPEGREDCIQVTKSHGLVDPVECGLTKQLHSVEVVIAVFAMPGTPASTSTSGLAAPRVMILAAAAVLSFNIVLLLFSVYHTTVP